MIAPYISRSDISAALASLTHNSRNLDGLRHLLLVDLRVLEPDMPAGDAARDYAVRALLVGEITGALSEQRALFRLAPPDEGAPLHHAQQELGEAVKVGAHELLAWSTLYARYVRSDLGLSVEALAGLMGVSTRTITRYNEDGIDLLTARLIGAEQTARREQWRRRLTATLPCSVPVRLFGRDHLLRSTGVTLNRISPRHVLISGAIGVGKTMFVQELLRHEIDDGKLDHLIWLEKPESALLVRQKTMELLRDSGEITLRDYLLLYHVAVVLDGIDALTTEPAALTTLLRDFGAALVILINRTRVPLESVEVQFTLPEIDAAAAELLVAEVLRLNADVSDSEVIANEVLQRAGGNPLALRLAVGMWEHGINWTALDRAIDERLFSSLDWREQQAWCALALFPRVASADELRILWQIAPDTLRRLERLAIVEGESRGYQLVSVARDYARDLPPQVFISLLERIDAPQGLDVIEQALATGFPERRAEWIAAYWREGLRRGHWARWREILDAHFAEAETVAPELRIAYATCLRRLSEWSRAEQEFYNVVTDCGRNGQFAEQSRALAEWSVLSRYQGQYERAQALVDQAKRYALRVRDAALLETLTLQEAQILIQQGRAEEAHKLLSGQGSVTALALRAEALLAAGRYAACRLLAERALDASEGDAATEASLYTLIGRSYQAEENWELAQRYLTDVVVLLERLGDGFALARAQTNLAAVLIPLGRYADADMLLVRAEQVQAHLGDRVGLSTTRHNRTILAGYIAR